LVVVVDAELDDDGALQQWRWYSPHRDHRECLRQRPFFPGLFLDLAPDDDAAAAAAAAAGHHEPRGGDAALPFDGQRCWWKTLRRRGDEEEDAVWQEPPWRSSGFDLGPSYLRSSALSPALHVSAWPIPKDRPWAAVLTWYPFFALWFTSGSPLGPLLFLFGCNVLWMIGIDFILLVIYVF